MQPRKIIAFDSWTEGAGNIERLVGACKARGFDLMLIHVGSWGHDRHRPVDEFIGDLHVRDIKYYGRRSFEAILQMERPDAVLFLSTQAFVHRAFNRYCVRMGVPTLHLYHGIVGVQNTASKRLNPLNLRSQVALVLTRMAKNLRYTWPVYIAALWRTRASMADWAWFARDVWRQVSGQAYAGLAAPDASTTGCCVYTSADIAHAVNRYRLKPDAVVPVGNPDLSKFGISEADIGACLREVGKRNKEIVYVDTALLEAGAVFDDANDFVRHLQETRVALECQGFRLSVKLHPIHYRTGMADRLRNNDIELCPNDAFVLWLKEVAGVIVEPSSAALIPAILGLPILLARYGKLTDQEYGDVLKNYPRSLEITTLEDICRVLRNIESSDYLEKTRTWIQQNTGPLPAEDMACRVANVCAMIAQGKG